MTFMFNFSKDKTTEIVKGEDYEDTTICALNSDEIFPTNQIHQLDDITKHARLFSYKDVELGHVIPSEVLAKLRGSSVDIQFAESKHSDLIPGTYEGGLKIWECTNDLLEYLIDKETKFENMNVLDLGCGAGLLGIYALLKGATVIFQDYNKDVLECVTIPNVLLNIEDKIDNMEEKKIELKKCRFFSGDWSMFNKRLEENTTFDIILTSETIYNLKNYSKLTEIFLKRLNRNGVIYLAAKTHYFGVGGGLRQFEKILDGSCYSFETCWNSLGGVQREILEIKLNR